MTELMIMFHGRPAPSSSRKHTVAYGPKVSEIDDFGGSSLRVAYGPKVSDHAHSDAPAVLVDPLFHSLCISFVFAVPVLLCLAVY